VTSSGRIMRRIGGASWAPEEMAARYRGPRGRFTHAAGRTRSRRETHLASGFGLHVPPFKSGDGAHVGVIRPAATPTTSSRPIKRLVRTPAWACAEAVASRETLGQGDSP
jgi:hypothetical protein